MTLQPRGGLRLPEWLLRVADRENPLAPFASARVCERFRQNRKIAGVDGTARVEDRKAAILRSVLLTSVAASASDPGVKLRD